MTYEKGKANTARYPGVDGFIHIASPLGGFSDVETAVSIGVNGGLNALKACAKTSSIKRFVFTSSSLAATFPNPDVEFSINEKSYNDEAMQILKKEPNKKGLYIYAAMKTETEKAMWKWMEENNPGFVLNTIVGYRFDGEDDMRLTQQSFQTQISAVSLSLTIKASRQPLIGHTQLGPAKTSRC
jgi:nucleoside-diphosphate-sugar epimerase